MCASDASSSELTLVAYLRTAGLVGVAPVGAASARIWWRDFAQLAATAATNACLVTVVAPEVVDLTGTDPLPHPAKPITVHAAAAGQTRDRHDLRPASRWRIDSRGISADPRSARSLRVLSSAADEPSSSPQWRGSGHRFPGRGELTGVMTGRGVRTDDTGSAPGPSPPSALGGRR